MAIPLTIVAMNFRAPLQILFYKRRAKGCGSIRSRFAEVTCSEFEVFSEGKKGLQVTADEFVSDIQH